MSQHDDVIDNNSPALVRIDFNNALLALASNSSGATPPPDTEPFQWWLDTANNLLKVRNAADSAWVTVGTPSVSNLGMLSLGGGSMVGALLAAVGAVGVPGVAFSGDPDTGLYWVSSNTWGLVAGGVEYLRISPAGITFMGTGATTLQSGTTAQRPGSPVNGMMRYNSDLTYIEAYSNSAWKRVLSGVTYPFSTDNFTDITPLTNVGGVPADFSGSNAVSRFRPILPWADPVVMPVPSPSPTDGLGVADVSFTKNGEWFAQMMSSRRCSIYKIVGKYFFRSSEVLPAGASTTGQASCAFSNSGEFIAIGTSSTSPLTVNRRGLGTNNWTTPCTLSVDPSASVQGMSWSHNDEFLAIGGAFTGNLIIYQRSGTVFTKVADPATLPGATIVALAFSPDSRFLIVVSTGTYRVYERTAGNIFTSLSTLSGPSTNSRNIAWSNSGEFVAVTTSTTTGFLKIYQRAGTVFTKLSNPSYFPAIGAMGVAWSPDDRYLAISTDTSPYIVIYERSGNTFTKLVDPTIAFRTVTSGRISWSPDGQFLAQASDSDPDVWMYNTTGAMAANSLLTTGKIFKGGT